MTETNNSGLDKENKKQIAAIVVYQSHCHHQKAMASCVQSLGSNKGKSSDGLILLCEKYIMSSARS